MKQVIKQMVNRFLGWKLPPDFGPDCGISFTPFHPNGTTRFEPIGTNLFTADQAEAMLMVIAGPEIEALQAKIDELKAELDDVKQVQFSAEVQAVIGGWKLVPVEATQEMLDAVGPKPINWDKTPSSKKIREFCDKTRRIEYKDMLSAAPTYGESK